MKLPFTIEVPDFKPRKHPGLEDAAPKFGKGVMDALDVTEQRSDFALSVGIRAWNAVWVLGAFHVLGVIVIVAVLTNSSAFGAVVKILKSFAP